MRVRVLFFGVLREAVGHAERWVELPEASRAGDASVGEATVGMLLRLLETEASPALVALWPRLAIAVNREYARHASVLHADDEVALLPPVSGGSPDASGSSMAAAVLLTHAPLDATAAIAALKEGGDGAVVIFDGIVRNNTRGRATEYLLYESYEAMALEKMQALVREATVRFPVREALLHHRLGRLGVGETSVLIAVASAHRGAAFDACRWIIDTLKTSVPIWKKEFFVDGAVWSDGEAFPPSLQPGSSA